jgi:hypothetical protein
VVAVRSEVVLAVQVLTVRPGLGTAVLDRPEVVRQEDQARLV